MKLLIDAGNSRIKWTVVKGADRLCSGALPVAQAGELRQHLAGHCDAFSSGLQNIEQVWASNVAGAEVAQHIIDIGRDKNIKPHFVTAKEEQCGVRNGYSKAGQLGSDRWAALIAAWHLVRGKCLVVNCGTATTIDSLSGQGEFLGGLIVPGVELMQRSLADATEQLKPGRGVYMPLPRNTADAMYSGAIQATCGAIMRQHALLDDAAAPVMLSGGAAVALKECLKMPLQVVDNLVLQGLLLIAQETRK